VSHTNAENRHILFGHDCLFYLIVENVKSIFEVFTKYL
jgi:hypothetical protein